MLELINVTKQYEHQVLDHISVRFPSTGLVIIVGESACGKSTLLHIIGGLDLHYEGQVLFQNQDIRTIRNYIKKHVGFIFQNIYLIDEMTVKDNSLLASFFKKIRLNSLKTLLKKLHLTSLYHEKAAGLSGGEKQRTAIMRTFLADNSLILCDEPTGSLDQENSEQVFTLLHELSRDRLVIVVSHDLDMAKKYGQYIYVMADGKLHLKKKKKAQCVIQQEKKKKKSFIYLMIKFFRLSFKSNLLLIQIIFIAFLSILLTFTLMDASHQQIQKKIEQIIPSTTIAGKKKNNQSLSVDDLKQLDEDYILYRCMEYSDIELIGLSLEDNPLTQQIFYVSDYSQRLNSDIIQGKKIQNSDEIVLSRNTYDDLCQQFQCSSLIDKEINIIFQNSQKSATKAVKIVGVSNQNTALSTVYLEEYAYSSFCQELFAIDKGDLCLLQIENIHYFDKLKQNHPLFDFQIANMGLTSSIDEKMQQLEAILIGFSFLLAISSCFLLGEVFYLNVIKRQKLFAIFKSFGASAVEISLLVISQGMMIGIIAFLQAVFMLKRGLELLNQIVNEYVMNSKEPVFIMNYQMISLTFLIAILLMILCCLIPVIKANKIDIIDGLKG